jgi:hypothetical protein
VLFLLFLTISTNYRSEPATNLILFVKTPPKLVSVTNQFSTADVAVKQLGGLVLPIDKSVNLGPLNGSNFMTLNVEKFVQGKG